MNFNSKIYISFGLGLNLKSENATAMMMNTVSKKHL